VSAWVEEYKREEYSSRISQYLSHNSDRRVQSAKPYSYEHLLFALLSGGHYYYYLISFFFKKKKKFFFLSSLSTFLSSLTKKLKKKKKKPLSLCSLPSFPPTTLK
jgi:hypothetical protein